MQVFYLITNVNVDNLHSSGLLPIFVKGKNEYEVL